MNRNLVALFAAVFLVSSCDKPVTEPMSLVRPGAFGRLIATNTYESTDVPKSIRDNQTSNSTLSVPDGGYITKVTVRFSITHTFDGDLRLSLTSPAGQRVVLLVNQRGGGGDNFNNTVLDDDAATGVAAGAAPYTGTFRPEQPLAGLIGATAQGTWTFTAQDLARGDIGDLTAWSLTITTTDEAPPTGIVNTYQSTDVPKAIRDLQTTTSTVDVPDIGNVAKVTVGFNITHTFDNDLRISLTSPGGTVVRLLVDRRGSNGDNFINTILDDNAPVHIGSGAAPFTGVFRPEEALSAFNGVRAQGTWTLTVQDVANIDVGTITAWSISITTDAANADPTADAGDDQTVTRGSPAGAEVTLDGTASMDSDGSIDTYEWLEGNDVIATGATPGHVFALGTHVVTLRVTDDDRAQGQDDVVITVENSPPTVTIDGPPALQCAAGGATANFLAHGVDIDGIISYAWVPTGATTAAASFFAPLGTTAVSVTVTDNDGSQASARSSVTVTDTEQPVISMVVSPTTLWSPNHEMVKVASGVSASDGCDSATRLTVAVTSNEPINGQGDGDTSPDWNVVANSNGTYDVYVRAERAGGGLGRIYAITARATDASGNVSSTTRLVNVPHDQSTP